MDSILSRVRRNRCLARLPVLRGSVLAQAMLAAGAFVLFTTPAHAYIDPGTGGMLLQLLLGGVAGALVIVKLYWYRIKEGFQRAFGGGPKSDEPSDRESGN